ncbi:MBL fold metallo-hydrolase [Halothermothrix orenii]|uniref:Beta-lactamase domain protein n=1 Tax=Halothermothrix orenii (strain H 168 / OCM 544 / DSM 9562) TaxID=373903 RepID=B8CZR9_HALOH|nr:MBL fold metallo-hydrolase [Halothermothrix orenii]ACL70771.1 beta-lactamase domain protein [Halothermothrix orenii H 168]
MSVNVSVLASGSSGNCVYITDGKVNILVDAGLSGKEIARRLKKVGVDPGNIDAILVTHEHKDHIKGVGILSRRYDIPVFANELTWKAAEPCLGEIKSNNCKIFDGDFSIGNLGVIPFSSSHDAEDPVGFVFKCRNLKLGLATDMGIMPDEAKAYLKGSDLLIIEANHDLDMLMTGSYPWFLKKRIRSAQGHLSNDDTAAILPELIEDNFPRILLAHLSQDNNIPELAYITVKNGLEEEGFIIGRDLEVDFAYREKPTRLYRVG